MGDLVISFVLSSLRIKKTTISPHLQNGGITTINRKQSFYHIEKNYKEKLYMTILMRLNSHAETEVNTLINQQA